MYSIILQTKNSEQREIQTDKSLLFVGANGSGKTRLGTWIEMESPQKDKVHRISAQKSLTMPDSTTPTSLERAQKDLLYGYAEAPLDKAWHYKSGHRWSKKPAVSMLNDYQKLMVFLFSDHTEESAKYLAASKATNERVVPPETNLDKVKKVWEKVLPHRELKLGGLKIETLIKGDPSSNYNASEMSDGERVIFYLIGQCLAAPKNGIIVVDEPEVHLHKSVQVPLWQEIQKLRDDCVFIFLTHDVSFASGMNDTQKIWLKSYDGKGWDWEVVEAIDNFPEELLIEVLGSRKPIAFVEGENGSYDTALYQAILKEYLVIPRGSCSEVILSTKALRASNQLHHLNVIGIIDRDRRVDEELKALKASGVYSLEVAEVENLFCVPEVLKIVSKHLLRDSSEDIQAISNFVFKNLQKELETQISLRVAGEIKFRLNLFDEKAKGKDKLSLALSNLASSIDVSNIYDEIETQFTNIIERKDYTKLLKLYNRKSISAQVSKYFDLTNGGLAQLVVRMALSNQKDAIVAAIKPYLGDLETPAA